MYFPSPVILLPPYLRKYGASNPRQWTEKPCEKVKKLSSANRLQKKVTESCLLSWDGATDHETVTLYVWKVGKNAIFYSNIL